MDCNASFLTYAQTGYFSKTVLDYVQQSPSIQPFYNHPVSLAGIKAAIEQRKKFPNNRSTTIGTFIPYRTNATALAITITAIFTDHAITCWLCTYLGARHIYYRQKTKKCPYDGEYNSALLC
jgi:hypothetical protein